MSQQSVKHFSHSWKDGSVAEKELSLPQRSPITECPQCLAQGEGWVSDCSNTVSSYLTSCLKTRRLLVCLSKNSTLSAEWQFHHNLSWVFFKFENISSQSRQNFKGRTLNLKNIASFKTSELEGEREKRTDRQERKRWRDDAVYCQWLNSYFTLFVHVQCKSTAFMLALPNCVVSVAS